MADVKKEVELDDDEEEEILVFADFRDLLDKELKKDGNLKLVDIVGIDSANPIIQLNNYFFRGEYKQSMGTHMFFEQDYNPPVLNPIFTDVPKTHLKYGHKTRKVLNMKRIFLVPKDENVKEEAIQNVYPPLETHASTIEEALDKFETYMKENDEEPTVIPERRSLIGFKTPGKKKGPDRPTLDDDID